MNLIDLCKASVLHTGPWKVFKEITFLKQQKKWGNLLEITTSNLLLFPVQMRLYDFYETWTTWAFSYVGIIKELGDTKFAMFWIYSPVAASSGENSLKQKENLLPRKRRKSICRQYPMTELTTVQSKGGCKTQAFVTKIQMVPLSYCTISGLW